MRSPEMTPAMTWWGKWAAMKTRDRQTQTWTAQNPIHSTVHSTLQGAGTRVSPRADLHCPGPPPALCPAGSGAAPSHHRYLQPTAHQYLSVFNCSFPMAAESRAVTMT